MRGDLALQMLIPPAAGRAVRIMERWFAQRLTLQPRGLDSMIEEAIEVAFLDGVRFGRNHAHPSRVRFAVPIYLTPSGEELMASITLPSDQEVMIPLVFSDAVGQVHAPPSGGSVSVADDSVALAVLQSNDSFVMVSAVADGQTTVTYTNDGVEPPITATLVVTVTDPIPTSVAFDPTGAIFGPLPTGSGTTSTTSSGGDAQSGGQVQNGGSTVISGTISGTVTSSGGDGSSGSSTDSGTTVSSGGTTSSGGDAPNLTRR